MADVVEKTMKIQNELGLHARAATKLVQLASKFPCELTLTKDGAYYPLSAITDGQGLNITVMSYGGQLHFGVLADRDLVPDVERIAGYLADELELLHKVVVQAR